MDSLWGRAAQVTSVSGGAWDQACRVGLAALESCHPLEGSSQDSAHPPIPTPRHSHAGLWA